MAETRKTATIQRPSAADRRFTVIERLCEPSGKVSRRGGGFERLTQSEALSFIKVRQREFERSGHDKATDRYWAWTAAHEGCAPERITWWAIERKT